MTVTSRLAGGLAFSLLCAAFNPASAELFTNPIGKSAVGKVQGMGFFGTSSVEYEDENGNKADVDRTFLGASGAFGINDAVDAFAAFVLITDAEIEGNPSDGDGTAFAFGVRGILPIQAGVKLHGYAQYLSIDEKYGNSIDGEETSLSVGVMASKKVDSITLYGGPEIILTSDDNASNSGLKFDADRDDTLGFRAGAQFAAGELDVNFGIALMHESGFMLGVAKTF